MATLFVAICGALLLVSWCAREDAQPDVYFHLACARWILEHGFPRSNVFLDPTLTHAFVDPEWAFQLGLLALESLGGERLIGLVKTLAVAGLAALSLRRVRGPARWALLIPFVLLAGPRFVVRPELVTYLGVAWHLSWRKPPTNRRLGWAACAQVVWANAHGFALLGPALCGVRAMTALLGGRAWRAWAVASALLLACCAVSPYPLGSLSYMPRVAWEAVGQGRLPLAELAAPWSAGAFDPTWLLLLGWTACALPLAWIGWRSGRLSAPHLAAAACTVGLGFPYARNLPLAALGLIALSGPGLVRLCSRALTPQRATAALVAIGVLAFGFARATVDDRFHTNAQVDVAPGFARVGFKAYPEACADWAEAPPPTPLFNGFSSGHYLIYAGQRPFICGNLDLYPRAHFEAYRALLAGDPRGFGERLASAGFRSAFLDHRELSPLLVEALVNDPKWGLRFAGPKAMLFVRGPASAGALLGDPTFDDEVQRGSLLRALTLLGARGFHPRLRLHFARALPALGEAARGLQLVRDALKLAPHDPVVLASVTELERLYGDPAKAVELCERWIAIDPSAAAHLTRGSLAMAQGKYRQALSAYQASLDTNPDADTALRAKINLLAAAEAAEDPVAIRRAVARYGSGLEPGLRQFYRGNAARLEADYPTALRWLKRCTETDPSLTAGWARLGEVHFLDEDYAQAVLAYSRLVELNPDAANWRDLGVAQERAGDPQAALESWRLASEANPAEVLAFIYSAKQHVDAGRREPALSALRAALARDPKHPVARRMLLKLRGGGQ